MNYKFFKLIKNKIISRLNLLIEKFYNKNSILFNLFFLLILIKFQINSIF